MCNFVTVDERYEDDEGDIAWFFTHQHPDYRGADDFDHYAASLLRRSDVLLLPGRRSSLGNLGYWTSVLDDPDATAIRRQFAALFRDVSKVVVSDTITLADLDELHLVTFPLIAGSGVPLFDDRPNLALKLLETLTWTGSGDVGMRWRVDPYEPAV